MGRHEVVPADRARTLIAAALQPIVGDFEHVRGLVWTTWLSDGIRAVIHVQALKGGQFDITYGVSCHWVPHRVGETYRWHRTLKQTRRDLWVDHFTADAEPRQWISTLEGEKQLRRQADKAVRQVTNAAAAWWAATRTEAGVLAEANRQAAHAFDIHEPRARFVAAFTHARLGDLVAAQRQLALVVPTSQADHLDALTGKLSEIVAERPSTR
ncbi:hypothetical protein ACQPXM_32755 [Kribbella sp. CA-253562]|uniref:hypothetical protein n=1 Tax=Kribbella sp. CA-253562 TaxID=3239942 RepID=UPI003D929065